MRLSAPRSHLPVFLGRRSVRRTGRRCLAGFTLLELLITLTLLGILLALTLPSFSTWLRNAKARSTAEALQTGLRLAQTEAVRRNRQVMLSLTNSTPSLTATAVSNGSNWVVRTVPVPGETAQFVEGASLGGQGVSIAVNSVSDSICFNSFGRLVDNQSPGASQTGGTAIPAGTCDLPASGTLVTYNLTAPNSVPGVDRNFRVTVALGGQIRLCDSNRTLATSPDGC